MNYTIFGCNNPTGEYFLEQVTNSSIEIWGRKKPRAQNVEFVYCDLSRPPQYPLNDINGIIVSFAPIWLLSNFLVQVSREQPERLRDLRGIIAISSSSFLTKKFAFSNYDKYLALSLGDAHHSLIELSRSLKIDCHILAPTLVYGLKNDFQDRNISKIIKILRLLPFVVLPQETGLRQPIHAGQLAQVAHKKAQEIRSGLWVPSEPDVLPLGGDDILNYADLIKRIQDSLPIKDRGRRCLIIQIPDRFFLLLVCILLPFNTRLFEAVMRIRSNLAGFPKASDLVDTQPRKFPVLPLSI